MLHSCLTSLNMHDINMCGHNIILLPAIFIVIESHDVIPVHSTSVLCIDIAAMTETVDSK